MARSIVLRFDATCVDCGRALPAGSTARWFGKGRVSCCGSDRGYPTPDRTHPADDYARVPPLPPSASDHARKFVAETTDAIDRARASRAELERAMVVGLTPSELDAVAAAHPALVMLVRLQSGARFLVPAEHARHVIRCIEESMVDRVRDVTRSPRQ